MNQTEQMREALRDCVKTMHQWRMCELGLIAGPTEDEIESVVTKAEQALSHVNETPKNEHDSADVLKPAKLVRLTEEEIHSIFKPLNDSIFFDYEKYAYAIMDSMQEKNK